MRSIILIITFNMSYAAIFSQVPHALMQKFERMYPYVVNPQWQNISPSLYRVIYTGAKDLKHAIVYNKEGIVLNHYRELTPNEIPDFIAANTTAYEGKKFWTEQTDSGQMKYFLQENNSFYEIPGFEKKKLKH